jgi:hypothetical protein
LHVYKEYYCWERYSWIAGYLKHSQPASKQCHYCSGVKNPSDNDTREIQIGSAKELNWWTGQRLGHYRNKNKIFDEKKNYEYEYGPYLKKLKKETTIEKLVKAINTILLHINSVYRVDSKRAIDNKNVRFIASNCKREEFSVQNCI